MASTAADVYNAALAQQQQLYNQIKSGYETLRSQQQSQQSAVTAGYNNLLGSVMGKLTGADVAARQEAKDQYTATSGREAQALVNRGLGNTTVASSVQRGLQYDYGKQVANIGANYAQLKAQYESQLGLAGLDWQGRAVGMNSALGSQELQAAQGFSPVYAQLYGGMAQAAMQQQQLDYQRQQANLDRMYQSYGLAGQQTAQAAGQANALDMAGEQLGFKYAALGAEQSNNADQLGYRYAQLAQQGRQFGQNLNFQYDRETGKYGLGAPSSYAHLAPSRVLTSPTIE